MQAQPITHIGVLVADLAQARERWSLATGFPFSPISRYRPQNWSDHGNPVPHLHDARLTFCLGDFPSIEILEFVGTGTHSPDKGEGGHHLSFPPLADNTVRRQELAVLGIGIDGEICHDGRWIFQFAEAGPLDNVYTEWVEEHPDHPDVKDDLSPVNRLPDGSKTLFDVETILALDGKRPPSGITEFGVAVADVEASARLWSQVTGYSFRDGLGVGPGAAVRLVPGERPGLTYVQITTPDLEATLTGLRTAGVPLTAETRTGDGHLTGIDVDPAYLNNLTLRYR